MIDQAITLLKLLSDGLPHSGTELGDKLGVSRAAVWKLIQKIQSQFGVVILSRAGIGYELSTPISWMNSQSIRDSLRNLDATCPIAEIHIIGTASSTNDLALAAATAGAPNFSIWLAEHQSSGRGRRGKTWQSPMLGNIYCSLLWRFSGGVHALEGLSLVVGIAIADAISSLGITNVELKWPNDILINGSKVGGVLIEISGDPVGDCAAVIGFGLNLYVSEHCKAVIDQPVATLSAFLPQIDRNLIIAIVLNNIWRHLIEFKCSGFQVFESRWSKYDALIGKKVRILSGSGFEEGECVGVNNRGGLMVKIGHTTQEIFSGEVSVRAD